MPVSQVEFSKELIDFISAWKQKPGSLIMMLHRIQEEFDYIPREAAERLARETGLPLAKIYGVITFYHFFKTSKPGKHKIAICLGTACYLRGGQDVVDEARSILNLKEDEPTDDGMFSIDEVRCLGCCGLAPVPHDRERGLRQSHEGPAPGDHCQVPKPVVLGRSRALRPLRLRPRHRAERRRGRVARGADRVRGVRGGDERVGLRRRPRYDGGGARARPRPFLQRRDQAQAAEGGPRPAIPGPGGRPGGRRMGGPVGEGRGHDCLLPLSEGQRGLSADRRRSGALPRRPLPPGRARDGNSEMSPPWREGGARSTSCGGASFPRP